MYRGTFKFLCLDNRSHAPATSETLKKCRKLLVSGIYLSNLLVLLLGISMKNCLEEKIGQNKATI